MNKILLFFVILFLLLNFNKEKFTYDFTCVTSEEDTNYINLIQETYNELEKDNLLTNKSYETYKLLDIYNILLCDIQNTDSCPNIQELKIITYIEYDLEYRIDILFNYLIDLTTTLINEISTKEYYNNNNLQILENIKLQFQLLCL